MNAAEFLRRKRLLMDVQKEMQCAEFALERVHVLGDDGWMHVAEEAVERAAAKLGRFNEQEVAA